MRKLAERGWDREVRRAVNELMEEMRSLRLVQGVGYRLKSTHLGQVIEIEKSKSGQARDVEIAKFQVVSIYRKRALCVKYNADGNTSEEQFNVVLPEAIWGDTEITGDGIPAIETNIETEDFVLPGSATPKTVTIYYDVWPDLVASDVLFAVRSDSIPTFTDTDGTECEWFDLNVDARQRQMRKYLSEVCVNGVTKYIAIRRSEVAD